MSTPRSSLPLGFLLLPCFFLARSEDLDFSFSSFSQGDSPSFDVVTYGAIQGGVLQLTYDSQAQTTEMANSTGRITYTQQLRLWNTQYDYTASFNTYFLINIEVPVDSVVSNTTGGGMAFILSSHTASESHAANSYGQWLGLFNESTVGAADSVHQLVAVELDTFKDSFDPDDNHLGIDLNSTVSIANASLALNEVPLINNEANTSVWVDYDGRGKQLNVFVRSGTDVPKPLKPVLSNDIDLRRHLPYDIYLGFSGSTGTHIDTHCVLAWNFTTSEGLPGSTTPTNTGLIVGIVLAAFVLLLAVVFVVVRRRRAGKPVRQAWQNLSYGPREFTYRELRKATDNFSVDCLLGEGGFGAVYKGTLADPNNTKVAVKRIPAKSRQGPEKRFVAEVNIIGRLRHRNLVPLLGWCQCRKGDLLLVYEYMPNGNLNDLLHKSGGEDLGWEKRYKVMTGLAGALLYLHEEWETVVVHRDLKPSNVMLDGEYNARLGDFGLARVIEGGSKVAETINIAGTPGYMAPECLETGVVTKESDLYGFGAVAMEVASGCRPTANLRRLLWQLQQEGRLLEAADPCLAAIDPPQMERLLLLSLACSHPDPAARPSIRQVVYALSSLSSPLLLLPPPLPPPLPFPTPLSTFSESSSPSPSRQNTQSPTLRTLFNLENEGKLL